MVPLEKAAAWAAREDAVLLVNVPYRLPGCQVVFAVAIAAAASVCVWGGGSCSFVLLSLLSCCFDLLF